MTKFTVKHACGHEAPHGYSGPEEELRRRKEWLQRRPCQACWRQEESSTAAAQSQELQLPALEGTEQDKAWAEVIRLKAVAHNRDYHKRLLGSKKVAEEEEEMKAAIISAANEALRDLENRRDARWWLDNRFEALSFVKSQVVVAITPLLNSRTK